LIPLSALFGAAIALLTAYCLGALALRNRLAPPEIALALGAVIESLLVFVLLLCNAGYRPVFLVISVLAIAASWKFAPVRLPCKLTIPRAGLVILIPYAVWYFVNALAPEITPDGITYHLALPREYVRLAGFTGHLTFYDLVPQGMEMLYTVAYAFGRHAAAKLVEFAFFVSGLLLIFRLARRLGFTATASLVPAALYFCAPVIGLTGSSSYNDAAGVFFLLAALYLLLEERLFAAGLCAGFCYAIKMPGILVPVCAGSWMLARRRPRAASKIAIGAAIAIAPWMIRAFALTGNPLAPLANRVFPNPYFHIATETGLAEGLRSLGKVRPAQVPWELALGGGLAGVYGPLLLLLPLGLFALRRPEGRLLWLGAAILALPWLVNSGARFLMQSVVLAGFALAMVLPRPAAWAAIALQAVICWPHVLDRLQPPWSFHPHEFPIAAALGIEPEPSYLRRHLEEYDVARMIQGATPPGSRTLALLNVAGAYLDREAAVFWQSAEADILTDSLRLVSLDASSPVFDWKAVWPAQDVRALRFLVPAALEGEWDICELHVFSGGDPVFGSAQWTFPGRPNRWEAPLAFDGNTATRWRTWEPVRAGMFFEADFSHAQRLTSATLVTHRPVPLEVWGRDAKDTWRLLTKTGNAVLRAPQDLRLDASRALRGAGYRYLLVPTGEGGNAPIGNAIVGREAEWGMERVGEAGRFYLFRVR